MKPERQRINDILEKTGQSLNNFCDTWKKACEETGYSDKTILHSLVLALQHIHDSAQHCSKSTGFRLKSDNFLNPYYKAFALDVYQAKVEEQFRENKLLKEITDELLKAEMEQAQAKVAQGFPSIEYKISGGETGPQKAYYTLLSPEGFIVGNYADLSQIINVTIGQIVEDIFEKGNKLKVFLVSIGATKSRAALKDIEDRISGKYLYDRSYGSDWSRLISSSGGAITAIELTHKARGYRPDLVVICGEIFQKDCDEIIRPMMSSRSSNPLLLTSVVKLK